MSPTSAKNDRESPSENRGSPIRIDSHVHIMPPYRMGGLMRWIKRIFPHHPVPEDVTADMVLEDLRAKGFTHFFNLVYPLKEEETDTLNEYNLEFCGNTPGAIPFASLHQDTKDKAGVVERALAAGHVGFKVHPPVQGFDPWDPRMEDLYAALEEVGRPLLMHTGFGEFYQRPMPAKELEKILKRHPRLNLVFVHMAFPELEQAFKMMDEFPGLYLDATNVLACFRPEFSQMLEAFPGGPGLKDVILRGVEEKSGRILYGSDHPVGMGGLDEIVADLDDLGLAAGLVESMRIDAPRGFIEKFSPGFDFSTGLGRTDRAAGIE